MFTLTFPYYNQPAMLRKQLDEIAKYPETIGVIIVDDGSADPASDHMDAAERKRVDLYRITEDIPWNQEQARNIAGYVCRTSWLLQTDIDHILPVDSALELLEFKPDPAHWYRFPRFRVGKADHTRKKDAIHHLKKFGQIHPHINSFLMTRAMFMKSPYDERYAGCLGGDTPFLEAQIKLHGAPLILPESIALHVHTTHSVPDASTANLDRDTSEYQRRKADMERAGTAKVETILHHPWERVA